MAAGNRSSVGFGPILLFHLCVLAVGVLLQNAYYRSSNVFYMALGAGVVLGALAGYAYRGFLWDLFRNFKSAGVLITLLCLSCILGTFIIQDLDLRRDGVYGDPKVAPGELPPFDSNNQATRFMLAESHGWLWLFPNEERKKLTQEKVVLSGIERAQVALRSKAFGEKAAQTFEDGILASKKRQVDHLTTSNFARENQKGLFSFYQWMKKLHLFDIFEAWWFYMLLGLIGVNVIVGTFARAPWTKRDFGVVITHSGIIIILMGALLDRVAAKEGYIYYVYGRPQEQLKSKIEDKKNRVHHQLPFSVYLERFATEYYHELFVRRFDWSRRADGSKWQGTNGESHGTPLNAVENYPIRAGVPLTFEGGKVTITVHEYKPRVFVESNVEDVAGGELNPAIEMAIYADVVGGKNLLQGKAPVWYFAKDRERNSFDGRDFRLEYVWADSAAEYDRIIQTAPLPDNGWLVVKVKDQPPVRVRVELGGKVRTQVGDQMLELAFDGIRSALADADNVNLDRRLQRSEEPVLWLKVNGREVFVPRDDAEFTRDFSVLQGVEFRFDWPDPKDRGVYNIYRIVGAENRPLVLLQADYNGKPSATQLRRGSNIALVGFLKDLYLGVTRSARSARARPGVREVTDEQFLAEGGGDKDQLLAAWAKVEIDGPFGKVERELTPFDEEIYYGDDGSGRPMYAFSLLKTNMALDWFSVLTVLNKKGQKIKSHAVQVNSPLRHKGYRFFQATASSTRDGLSVSGISVTYNPGVNFMYVGFYVLTLGVCYLFFLRPLIDRDRRRGGILFDFKGRIDRVTFWKSGFALLLAIDVVAVAATILLGGGGVLWFFVLFWWIPTLWPRLGLHVKRSHDVNRPGWFWLVPFLSWFEIWGMRSYPQENAHGPVPAPKG